jgi:hypothetical protein
MLGRSECLSEQTGVLNGGQWQPYLIHDRFFPPAMLSGAHLDNLTHSVKQEDWNVTNVDMLRKLTAGGKRRLLHFYCELEKGRSGRHAILTPY